MKIILLFNKLIPFSYFLFIGLDVPSCCKVILFDQLSSMTEFVQSRGRARDRNSELIIVSNQGERRDYEALIETEKKLAQLIQPMMKDKSHLKTKIIEALNKQIYESKSSNDSTQNYKKSYYYEDIKFFLQV
jgi:ERCC4-related helicase